MRIIYECPFCDCDLDDEGIDFEDFEEHELKCPSCGKVMKAQKDVLLVWYLTKNGYYG